MTKNVLVHALFDSGVMPASYQHDFYSVETCFIEKRGRHPFGTVSNAGSHVIRMRGRQESYGSAGFQFTATLTAPGFVTWWSAAAIPSDGFSSWAAGAYGPTFASTYDSVPHDWQPYFLHLEAGDYAFQWFSGGPYQDDGFAHTTFVSKIEVYEGDEQPVGQSQYTGGGADDPRATTALAVLQKGGDATPPPDFQVTNGQIEPNGAHTPSFWVDRPRIDPEFGDYVLFLNQVASASFTVTAGDGGGTIDWIHEMDGPIHALATIDGVAVVDADTRGFDARSALYGGQSLTPGVHTVQITTDEGYEAIADDTTGYYVSRLKVFSLSAAPPSVAASEVGDDPSQAEPGEDSGGGGGGGGGTPPAAPAYKKSEYVRHKGGLYIARVDGPTTEPGPGDSADWFEMVARPAAGAAANPYAVPVRATVGMDTDPFAAGEEGLWVVLNADRSAAVDLRWHAAD